MALFWKRSDILIEPNYIAFYWKGSKLPEWRRECVQRLRELYPNAVYVSEYSTLHTSNVTAESNRWRIEQASKYENFLWVDNDIYLDDRLLLPDGPAMADEYKCNHWSIVWSGNNPDFFKNKVVTDLMHDKSITRITIPGIHYGSDLQGNRCLRRTT